MQKIRQPKQQRSIQTKKQITKAAFQLFAEKGIHGTNSKEIVKVAGVSIGSFYSYFKNKKTLLLEMLEEYLENVFSAIWLSITVISFEQIGLDEIRLIVENAFKAYEIAPEFHRQTHALRYSDSDINRIYEHERIREITQIKILLERNANLLNQADLYAAAIILHNLVESAIHTYYFLGPKVDKEDLIRQLSMVVLSYIQTYENQAKEKNSPDAKPFA